MHENFLLKMLLLIWKSILLLWDYNNLFCINRKLRIINTDSIDTMTYFELEQEVSGNISFVDCLLLLQNRRLYFSKVIPSHLMLVPSAIVKQYIILNVKKYI